MQCPLTIPHGGFLRFVTAPPVPGIGGRPKPPLRKGGASAPPRRGDTQAPPGYFLPNHSYLFPKKPSPFHIGSYFCESPHCESLSHGCAAPAPFDKGAFGCAADTGRWRCSRCIDQSPPCQRGVPRLAEAGGFRRQSLRNFLPIPSSLFTKKPSPFHMGLCF